MQIEYYTNLEPDSRVSALDVSMDQPSDEVNVLVDGNLLVDVAPPHVRREVKALMSTIHTYVFNFFLVGWVYETRYFWFYGLSLLTSASICSQVLVVDPHFHLCAALSK